MQPVAEALPPSPSLPTAAGWPRFLGQAASTLRGPPPASPQTRPRPQHDEQRQHPRRTTRVRQRTPPTPPARRRGARPPHAGVHGRGVGQRAPPLRRWQRAGGVRWVGVSHVLHARRHATWRRPRCHLSGRQPRPAGRAPRRPSATGTRRACLRRARRTRTRCHSLPCWQGHESGWRRSRNRSRRARRPAGGRGAGGWQGAPEESVVRCARLWLAPSLRLRHTHTACLPPTHYSLSHTHTHTSRHRRSTSSHVMVSM